MWNVDVRIEDSFRELPSLVAFEERVVWLKAVMQRTWDEVDDALVPAEVGLDTDTRPLGIAVRSIRVE